MMATFREESINGAPPNCCTLDNVHALVLKLSKLTNGVVSTFALSSLMTHPQIPRWIQLGIQSMKTS
jgi:hypothetical protein